MPLAFTLNPPDLNVFIIRQNFSNLNMSVGSTILSPRKTYPLSGNFRLKFMINIPLNFWAFDAAYLTDARQCITLEYIARQDVIMAKKSISLRMDEEKIKKLDAIAYSQDRSRSYIIEEAVEAYVSFEDEKAANVRKAIAEMERGEGIPHEEMKEFFEELRERAFAKMKP
jgi:predicted transcriptional regulator